MKKIQRSFVVEYKSARQKSESHSDSIWGNTDLKSVARDVAAEAMPFDPDTYIVKKSDGEPSLSIAMTAAPLLTPPIGQHTTTAVTEDTIMADEIDTMTSTDAPSVVETPSALKKQRQPRAKKTTPEAVATDAVAEPAVAFIVAHEKRKRGRKAKSIDGAGTAKRAAVKRPPKAVSATAVAPTESEMPVAIAAAGDEMADLLQLEEENQKLRKLLAEKLRAENADLRKRLNLD